MGTPRSTKAKLERQAFKREVQKRLRELAEQRYRRAARRELIRRLAPWALAVGTLIAWWLYAV